MHTGASDMPELTIINGADAFTQQLHQLSQVVGVVAVMSAVTMVLAICIIVRLAVSDRNEN